MDSDRKGQLGHSVSHMDCPYTLG